MQIKMRYVTEKLQMNEYKIVRLLGFFLVNSAHRGEC